MSLDSFHLSGEFLEPPELLSDNADLSPCSVLSHLSAQPCGSSCLELRPWARGVSLEVSTLKPGTTWQQRYPRGLGGARILFPHSLHSSPLSVLDTGVSWWRTDGQPSNPAFTCCGSPTGKQWHSFLSFHPAGISAGGSLLR